MGGAFVGSADDASSLIWNPAGLARLTRFSIETDFARIQEAGTNEHFAALALPSWRWGAAGISIRHVGVDGIEQRDDRNQILPGEIGAGETEIALGYARSMRPGFETGATFKLQRAGVGNLVDIGYGADVGVALHAGELLGERARWIAPFSLGLALRNAIEPAQRLDRESIADPRLLRVGLAWRRQVSSFSTLNVGADVDRAAGVPSRLHLGAEWSVGGLLALRTGLDDGHLAAGTSVRWQGLELSYVFEQHDMGVVQRIGLSKGLGPTVAERREAVRVAGERELSARLEQAYDGRLREQVDGLLARAEEARAAGDLDEMFQAATAAHALAPSDPRGLAMELAALRAQGARLESEGDLAGAALAYGRALETSPGDSAATRDQRRVQDGLARQSKQARRAQELEAAYRLFGAGDLLGARAAFQRLRAALPSDTAAAAMLRRVDGAIAERIADRLERARREVEAGRFDQADRLLDEANALGAGDSQLASLRQASERGRRRPSEKIQVPPPAPKPAAREVTALQRREADAWYRRGLDAAAGKQIDSAVRFWELAIALDPEHAAALQALEREYLLRGMVAFGRGRFRDAEASWARVLELDPGNTRARGYLDRARSQIQRTRELTGSRD